MCVCTCACVCMHADQKRGSDPLELELDVLGGHLAYYVGAKIQTVVLMTAQVFLTEPSHEAPL